jgi:YidC/Oxa1 family membrane protein insertase
VEWIGQFWDLIILNPVINVLIVVSDNLGGNFGLTIIVFTIFIRAAMYPLTLKQLRASKAMQALQSEVAEIRKKYAKDKQRAAQEQMRLFKESGVSPAGCLIPMLIQFPVWIALYQSIIRVLAIAPEDFLNLSQRLYTSWPSVFSLVPLESKFLWLDLSVPDRWLFLPILVGGTMWVQMKMTTTPGADPRQQAQSQMMVWMMPLMFAFFTMTFPSGLALYWVTSNVISIVMQYFVVGWGGLASLTTGRRVATERKIKGGEAKGKPPLTEDRISADIVEPAAEEEELDYGKSGDERQDRGGSYPARLREARRRPRGGRGHRRKRR